MPTAPYSDALRPGYTVRARAPGSCWTGSISTARPDAWRCMTGNQIHDPCYAGLATAKIVYCPDALNRKRLFAIALTKPLPTALGNRGTGYLRGLPASVVLVGGVTCTFLTGATGVVAGMRINYGCSDHRMLIGDIDRRAPRWRIFALPSRGEAEPSLVAIDTAVY